MTILHAYVVMTGCQFCQYDPRRRFPKIAQAIQCFISVFISERTAAQGAAQSKSECW